uniref:Uncharacterized protein n=1 Tax=Arundo donax TaxID=35708 RepID=A0A0A9BXX9_ARUDO
MTRPQEGEGPNRSRRRHRGPLRLPWR